MGLKCMKSITTTLSWTWTFPLLLVTLLFAFKRHRTNHVESKKLSKEKDPVEKTLVDLIGNTPVILIPSLSEATGCKIWGKAEFMNPGGSSKDRIALSILRSAESSGQLQKGGKVFEGTVGSTGLSLVMLCNALGYECHLVVPNDVAQEKLELLNVMGAKVQKVPPASISHPEHFVNIAKQKANQENGLFVDQFENEFNFLAHYTTTGPEIFNQTHGNLDVFVSGAGTGGTLAGITHYLKPRIPNLKVVVADPYGSGLVNKIKYNVMYSVTEAEGTRRRHQVDSLVEGIGLNRMTYNFALTHPMVDDAVVVSDQEAVAMARYVLKKDGLFLGSSSAVHLVACVKLAWYLGPGHRLLTILSDSGSRHLNKFWSQSYLNNHHLSGDTPSDLKFVKPLDPSIMKF